MAKQKLEPTVPKESYHHNKRRETRRQDVINFIKTEKRNPDRFSSDQAHEGLLGRWIDRMRQKFPEYYRDYVIPIMLSRPGEVSREDWLSQYKQFLKLFKRNPQIAKGPVEESLHRHAVYFRSEHYQWYKDNVEKLWEKNSLAKKRQTKEKRLKELTIFVSKYKRCPRNAGITVPTEKGLRSWISVIKIRNPVFYKTYIEPIIQKYPPKALQPFATTLKQLKVFLKQYGRKPRSYGNSRDPHEKYLGTWISTCRMRQPEKYAKEILPLIGMPKQRATKVTGHK